MRITTLLFLALITFQFTQAQSEHSFVEKTLQNYMEGSSYAKLKMLKSAFADDATLYLTNKEGLFKIYTPSEYTDFFKNSEKGKFNGRDAKVLAIVGCRQNGKEGKREDRRSQHGDNETNPPSIAIGYACIRTSQQKCRNGLS